MSKYDRDSRDVYAVKRLGDEIGYGHLMALAHELWARHLEEKGLPRKGAHCVVGYPMIKDEYQADAINDPIYKVIVERALADTPQTDCYMCKWIGDRDVCGRCRSKNLFAEADTPQTDAEITELAKEIVHKMIDNSDIAEDAYPDLRQRMHEAVERLDEYYPSEDERSE